MSHQHALPDDKNSPRTPHHAGASLLFDLSCWREQLARSIARNNVGLQSERITMIVNRIIFSLMFLRIAEDRGIIREGYLQNIQDSYQADPDLRLVLKYSLSLYDDVLPSGQTLPNDPGELVLDNSILTAILSKLTSADRQYDLAAMPTETVSQVFSMYLTKTIRRSAAHQVVIVDTHDTTQSNKTAIHQLTAIEYMVMRSLETVQKNRSGREILPIRLIDPACGAGVILLLAYSCLLENTLYGTPTFEESREILTGSLHGLDINRHAVAVARMLLLFRLMENRYSGQYSHNFFALSEEVFSELRYTVRCGNALIGPDIVHDESWMFCPPRERHELNTFDWPDGFTEIFATGGFDAVVCNPPEGVLEDREWIQHYFQRHYQVYHPLADQSVYFVEKGVSLLRSGGTLSCILSNRWLRGSPGSPFRMFLNTKQIEEIVDPSSMDKNKSRIAPGILRLSNRSPKHPFSMTRADIRFSSHPDDIIRAHRFPVDQRHLDEGGWTLADTRIHNLIKKVNLHGVPLVDFVMGQVHTGIKTGSNTWLLIDDDDRKNLIKKDSRNKKFIRRLMEGSDLSRYLVLRSGRSVIFIPKGWTDIHQTAANNPWQWFKKRYPLIARHLKKSGRPATRSSGSGDLWWESTCPDDFWFWNNPKILFRDLFDKPAFAYDEGQSIADPTICAIASSSLYLLGLLNSRLLTFVFFHSVSARSLDQPLYSFEDLKSLPIYTPDFDIAADVMRHSRLESLVKKMLAYHKQIVKEQEKNLQERILKRIEQTDRQINKLVYELYGLTIEEIAVVEEGVESTV